MRRNKQKCEIRKDFDNAVCFAFPIEGCFVSMPPKDDKDLRHFRYVVYDTNGNPIFGLEEL